MGDQIFANPLRDQIYAWMRDEMNKGRLLPGELINMSEISRRIGISKTPLREALIQLECDGFVTTIPRKGVMINRMTLTDVEESWEICRAFEYTMMQQVFKKVTTEDIARMEEINKEMKEASADQDPDRFYQLNTDFHATLLDRSQNRHMRRILKRIKQRLYDFLTRVCLPEWEGTNLDEHDHLLSLLKEGKGDQAAAYLRDVHWSFEKQEYYIRQFYKQDEAAEV